MQVFTIDTIFVHRSGIIQLYDFQVLFCKDKGSIALVQPFLYIILNDFNNLDYFCFCEGFTIVMPFMEVIVKRLLIEGLSLILNVF